MEKISLIRKSITFYKGYLACLKTGMGAITSNAAAPAQKNVGSRAMRRIFAVLYSMLLALVVTACSNHESAPTLPVSQAPVTSLPAISAPEDLSSGEQTNDGTQIQIVSQSGNVIVFELNASTAAQELYQQLPLVVEMENYSSNEKIFYPREKLSTSGTPLAKGPAGTLAYFEPWGNVAIFYGDCGGADGLYELGTVISGVDSIAQMTGEIRIEVMEAMPPFS